jgi:hypothetical protein
MPRELSANQNTYLAGNSLIGITLIEIGINGSTNKFYTDAPFDIDYDGDTYEAQGNFLGVSETSETANLQITSINLILSALDIAVVLDLCDSNQINQPVTIRKAFLDPTDYSLIGDSAGDRAIVIFKGKITSYRIENAEQTATINLEVTSQFANFNRTTGRRTNQGSLQREHATDFGFQYAHEPIQDIKWGKK